MAEVEKIFDNGNHSIRLDSGRLVRLPAHVVEGLKAARGIGPFVQFYRNEPYFSCGPERTQVKKWEKQPDIYKHTPYLFTVEVAEILETLKQDRLAHEVRMTCGQQSVHTCAAYRQWRRSNMVANG